MQLVHILCRILKWVTEEGDECEESAKRTIQAVILDMSSVMNIDTSGIIALEELQRKLASNGIQVSRFLCSFLL